jgi:hypothetical protein
MLPAWVESIQVRAGFGLDWLISPLWHDGFTLFLSIVVQALPFLLLGVLLSGLIAVFVDEAQLNRWLPRGKWQSSAVGGALGFFFPVCECGNLPVARRLVSKGVPPHVAIAFLLAAPVFNPVVIIATWIAFKPMPEMVIYRVGLSFLIAVVVGWIFSFQRDDQEILHSSVLREREALRTPARSGFLQRGTFLIPPKESMVSAGGAATLVAAADVYREGVVQPMALAEKVGLWARLDQLVGIWSRELRELGSVLVMGASIAALIQTLVPRSVLLDYGQGPVISVVVMLIMAAVVSICSTVDAFFALAFVSTFTPGSLLAFLVFGPMIDLKAIGLMLTLFKPKAIIYTILLTLQMTLLASLAFNFFGI